MICARLRRSNHLLRQQVPGPGHLLPAAAANLRAPMAISGSSRGIGQRQASRKRTGCGALEGDKQATSGRRRLVSGRCPRPGAQRKRLGAGNRLLALFPALSPLRAAPAEGPTNGPATTLWIQILPKWPCELHSSANKQQVALAGPGGSGAGHLLQLSHSAAVLLIESARPSDYLSLFRPTNLAFVWRRRRSRPPPVDCRSLDLFHSASSGPLVAARPNALIRLGPLVAPSRTALGDDERAIMMMMSSEGGTGGRNDIIFDWRLRPARGRSDRWRFVRAAGRTGCG